MCSSNSNTWMSGSVLCFADGDPWIQRTSSGSDAAGADAFIGVLSPGGSRGAGRAGGAGSAPPAGAGTVLCVPPVGRDTVNVTPEATVTTFIHPIGVLASDHDGAVEAVHKEEAP